MGYLVVSRHTGERIIIGEDIEILVSDINHLENKVDLAIKAPRSLKISRRDTHAKEIYGSSNRNRKKTHKGS